MSWFKVDDKLHSHPKWLALPKGAAKKAGMSKGRAK